MRVPGTARVLLLIGAAVAAVGATIWMRRGSETAPSIPSLRGANVLLVTIDTLRADRLGAYGSRAGLTPTLDALAARGIRFTHAWSHVPLTLPAHTSILTGFLPPHHGVRNNGSFRLGDRPRTLAEMLRDAGYRTGAFVGAFVLDARFGLTRGFDLYDDRYATARSASFHFVERPGNQVLDAATKWIERPAAGDARPWFAWVHLFDPHAPYQAPPEFARGRAPYDGEVAWTDAALGKALDQLRSHGRLDHTIIVVTADHGESLGDHGETTHGLFAYDATLRVPLIVTAPGLSARNVSAPAAHVDIVPTLLDLLALPRRADLDGRSLREEIAGRLSGGAQPVYFETLDANLTRGWAPLRGVVEGSWKYIDLPEPELYDLERDPGETTNVIGADPLRVQQLQADLRRWTASPIPAGGTVDAATAARLQSLGYASGSASPRASYTAADDPKRLVALSESFNAALDDFSSGRPAPAVETLSRILAARPDFLAARLSAATVLIDSARGNEAVQLLEEAPAADQSSSAWRTRMGQALAAAGRLREARDMLTATVTTMTGDPEPLNELGVVLVRLGQVDEARRTFQRLLALDPTAVSTWYNVGLLEMNTHHEADAAAAFRRVVELDARHADGWRGLGAVLAGTDPAQACSAWEHVVELHPRDFDTLFNLGVLLLETGRTAEAVPHLKRFLAEAPRDRYARDLPRVRALLTRAGHPS